METESRQHAGSPPAGRPADGNRIDRIWSQLEKNAQRAGARRIIDLFADDGHPNGKSRFDDWSARSDDLLLDWSKTNIDAEARDLLFELAEACGVARARDRMFAGERVNNTDDRPALHTALRNLSGSPVLLDGEDVMPGVIDTRERMLAFSDAIRAGTLTGSGGQPFADVVHIGIGGSQLGPEMACLALRPYHDGPRVHFLSNVDGAHSADILGLLDPATTLVIVASKSFSTPETMANAVTVRGWLADALGEDRVADHLVAISTADARVRAFGIRPDRVFGFADWVGGRLSMWGPIGLPLMLAIGGGRFVEFLDGGQAMDRHFRDAPPARNLPVILGLVGIWHGNLCGYSTRAIIPYDQRLNRFAAFVQQVDMESNGKSRRLDGTRVVRDTGPVVWGEPGTNAQHSVAQLLHQGTRVVPVEFLVARHGHERERAGHHRMLVANCIAQSEALMAGRSIAVATGLMREAGYKGEALQMQAAHRVFEGDRPSLTLVHDRLDPRTLGRLVALYEHRVFVEAAIWGINCFDQWGVELGKELAANLESWVGTDRLPDGRDSSTLGLLRTFQHLKES